MYPQSPTLDTAWNNPGLNAQKGDPCMGKPKSKPGTIHFTKPVHILRVENAQLTAENGILRHRLAASERALALAKKSAESAWMLTRQLRGTPLPTNTQTAAEPPAAAAIRVPVTSRPVNRARRV